MANLVKTYTSLIIADRLRLLPVRDIKGVRLAVHNYTLTLTDDEARDLAAQLARVLTRDTSDDPRAGWKTRADALRALADQIGEE